MINTKQKDFKAIKLVPHGEIEVDVISFNGVMAVCGDDDGCVLITKEQAKAFFSLVDKG